MTDTSYAAVMARKNDIMRSSLGLDYDQFTSSPIAFDYEALMNASGYSLEDVTATFSSFTEPPRTVTF